MPGHKYLKFYTSYDIYCANIIRNYRYYYDLFQSPYEDVIRTVSCDYSGTSDKGPSDIGTRDTCFDPMLIL